MPAKNRSEASELRDNMVPYAFLMSCGVFAALGSIFPGETKRLARFLVFTTLLVAWFMMTFRYRIGGDWFSYEKIYNQVSGLQVYQALFLRDPGYMLINIISSYFGTRDMWLVNGIGALIMIWGIASFSLSRHSPGIAVLSCIPYLIVVVGMGYARQAIAIGLIMVAIKYLESNRRFLSIILLISAASFHKTAIIMLGIVALSISRSKLLSLLLAVIVIPVGYVVFLEDSMDRLVYGYIDKGYSSGGAVIRTLMLAVCGTAYLFFLRWNDLNLQRKRLWTIMSMCGISLFIAVFISPSSTAVDRLGLYLIPLLVHVQGDISAAFRPGLSRHSVGIGILLINIAILIVWFAGAKHLTAWLPYRSYFDAM